MLRQGLMLLTRFCQDDRIQISQPRRKSADQFSRTMRARTISSPTSTPSANSTARAACWSGRPLRADILKSLTGYCLDPQACLLLVDDWHCRCCPGPCLSANDWSRFSICAQTITDAQREEFGHLVVDTSDELSRRISYRTAVSAFPRTPAATVPMLDFVLESKGWRTRFGAASRS